MTFIYKIGNFLRKKYNFLLVLDLKTLQIQKYNPIVLVSFLIFFSIIFFVSSNLIDKKNRENANNLKEITETGEFANLTNFFISKINSPYEEVNYLIKNNDT